MPPCRSSAKFPDLPDRFGNFQHRPGRSWLAHLSLARHLGLVPMITGLVGEGALTVCLLAAHTDTASGLGNPLNKRVERRVTGLRRDSEGFHVPVQRRRTLLIATLPTPSAARAQSDSPPDHATARTARSDTSADRSSPRSPQPAVGQPSFPGRAHGS